MGPPRERHDQLRSLRVELRLRAFEQDGNQLRRTELGVRHSKYVGDVFGAPLAMEALIAFFLESTFIGLWIFGWGRLSPRLHLATIC